MGNVVMSQEEIDALFKSMGVGDGSDVSFETVDGQMMVCVYCRDMYFSTQTATGAAAIGRDCRFNKPAHRHFYVSVAWLKRRKETGAAAWRWKDAPKSVIVKARKPAIVAEDKKKKA